jgi:hypothetical protein
MQQQFQDVHFNRDLWTLVGLELARPTPGARFYLTSYLLYTLLTPRPQPLGIHR